MKYSEQRIPTLNEYCVVCDEQHVFQNGSMLKVPEMRKRNMQCIFIYEKKALRMAFDDMIWWYFLSFSFMILLMDFQQLRRNGIHPAHWYKWIFIPLFLRACVLIQPAVCTRELCVFSFYTLGVMSGAAEEVATGAEVTTTQQIYIYYNLYSLYFLPAGIYSYFTKKKNFWGLRWSSFLIICTLHVFFILVIVHEKLVDNSMRSMYKRKHETPLRWWTCSWLCVELRLSLLVRASSLSRTHPLLTPMTPRLWPSTQRSAPSLPKKLWLTVKSIHKFNSKMTHPFLKPTAAVRTTSVVEVQRTMSARWKT